MASLKTADEDEVRVAPNQQDKNSEWLFIQLSALTPATRVHILCTEFLPLYNAYEVRSLRIYYAKLPSPILILHRHSM